MSRQQFKGACLDEGLAEVGPAEVEHAAQVAEQVDDAWNVYYYYYNYDYNNYNIINQPRSNMPPRLRSRWMMPGRRRRERLRLGRDWRPLESATRTVGLGSATRMAWRAAAAATPSESPKAGHSP